jgi:hypothetical protein
MSRLAAAGLKWVSMLALKRPVRQLTPNRAMLKILLETKVRLTPSLVLFFAFPQTWILTPDLL